MKKMILFAVFVIINNYYAHAEEIPTFYFDFGTKRSDIIFELGEPKYHLSGGHLHYESYTNARTLETTVFIMDKNKKLTGITIDIGLDVSPSIPLKEYIQKVYKYYGKIFKNIYGDPHIINKTGVVWVFDDGFSIFQPYGKGIFQRFKFICATKEEAKGATYEALYR